MHLQSACGDLGDIEHLIDEMPQVCRGCGNPVHWRHLSRREISIETVAQEFDETDDGVERRSQLMRDVGQEFTLRLIGSLHVTVQPLEFD